MTVTITSQGDVAIVTIDNPPVNATSHAVRMGLMDALTKTEPDSAVRAVVLTGAGRTFVAGADVKEFDAEPVPPHLPDVVAAIEAATKPWVAALHGHVLGGGLELAMGCHWRVAMPQARLGLPEVTLGLIPGAGGTVRLPRLVPPQTALTMIAGGKPITAEAGLKFGLIDALAEDDLRQTAIQFAKAAQGPRRSLSKPVTGARDENFAKVAAQLAAKARGQQSVTAAIAAVERTIDMAPEQALAAERTTFLGLKASPQAKALRRLFFAERATLNDPRCKGPARPIDRVGVIGGGTMGAGIAAACLLRGLTVTMVERNAESAAAGATRLHAIVESSAKRGIIVDTRPVLDRFKTATDYAALADRDLVIEAVFEDIDVKCDVFRQLDAVLRPDAVIATNTSYLDINTIAATLRDPSRAIGLHFFSPAHIMKLLEIVLPDQVSDDVVATAAKLAKRLGKIGVLAGICDGFIGNRIMSAYRREADYLLEDGASPTQVDDAMRAYGLPMGVFEMQDLAGLDIAWAMRKRRAATRDPTERYVDIADQLCALGRFGQKTGKGWYDYDNGMPVPSKKVDEIIAKARSSAKITPRRFTADDIMERILAALRSEAAAVLAEGIARSADDINVVMVNGYGFPRWTGGPITSSG